jgi:hypothetical protein
MSSAASTLKEGLLATRNRDTVHRLARVRQAEREQEAVTRSSTFDTGIFTAAALSPMTSK